MESVTRLIEKGTAWAIAKRQNSVPYQAYNPFLTGAFAPLKEEYTETELQVTGTIPTELMGLLLRIGPNPQKVDNPATYNWFLGDGMVHGLRLQDGKAQWYRNRYIGVDSVNAQRSLPPVAGSRRGIFDVVNTNIIGHQGKLWALVEAGSYPAQLDTELNTVNMGLFNSDVNSSFTAHPHIDPDTSEMHAICYDGILHRRITYLVIGVDGQVKRQVTIPLTHGPMIHDCAITKNNVVILDLPVHFSVKTALAGGGLPYAWDEKQPARIGLLPRQGQAEDIRWFEVDPCFSFHICNAFEASNGDTIVDLVVHGRTFYRSLQGPEGENIAFERWTLPVAGGRVQRKVISRERQEFPRFDERLTGKAYRYAYAVGISASDDAPQPNVLYRHDLHTGQTLTHDYGDSYMTGEVVFVPCHADSAEDDGWLMSYVHNLDGGPSRVVILDAQKLGQTPQAVIELPVRVPLGFHGNWVADVL